MKTKLFFFIILLCNFAATAQTYNPEGKTGQEALLQKQLAEVQSFFKTAEENDANVDRYAYNRYEGSPYLDKEFQTGSLIKKDSSIFDNLKLRYNIYNDRVEFLKKDIIKIVPSRNFTSKVIIGEKTFKLSQYLIKGHPKFGYLEQLTQGDCCLYYRHKVSLNPAVQGNAYQEPKPAKFVNAKGMFFIQLKDEPIMQITKKKHLIVQLSNNNNDIQKFYKKEKINIKMKEDFIKLVQYYNELNESSK
ncbi:hypothetical protein EV201_0673 [Ancylomarina subtilis]|uniref:GLPGLI family protein n=1 Tax=Ancylomarina subtilis TaxID=1639035 RepID=A0A4Q7VIS4_9BACT|nr:hypothetical protein [Ancylomarina subtilis]RZT96042.1 hypothetical protein EV201_0673 [Ancylomarina subtilis]